MKIIPFFFILTTSTGLRWSEGYAIYTSSRLFGDRMFKLLIYAMSRSDRINSMPVDYFAELFEWTITKYGSYLEVHKT